MWPIGHVAGAYLIHALGYRHASKPPTCSALVVLVVASGVPDLVDKPLAWYVSVLPTGRSLSHSLLFVVPLCLLVGIVTRHVDRPALGIAFAIGALSHLLFDVLPVMWRETDLSYLLYPVTDVEPYPGGAPTVLDLLHSSIDDPYFHLEFLMFVAAVVVWRGQGHPGLGTLRGFIDRAE